ncbi:MAG: M50 family metallopeptidase, partial [bacterium]|nr:M50 family metallopeptidase [bacterium]
MKNALTEIGDYPKMSSHLKVEGTPNNERAHYLLKNTRTGKMLKLGDNEYSVLASLDGKTSIGEIREKFNQAAPGSLEALIESFYNLHLLEQDCAPEEVRKGAKGFFKSLNLEKVFKVKFNFGNPDKLLTALYRPFKFIFNKYFVIATTLLALYGIGILLFNISTTANLFWEQVSNGEVLILFIPLFFVFILHEFSHGLTTKHYGGEIREMGFMLFYLRPAFYVDITDSYKFKKRERIAVYFAGLYFQLVLNGLILLGLQLAGFPLHKTGRLLWGFAAFNMLMIVMNLLPFIKLDGYWILTVILGIDNLRTKSFNACKRFVFETLLGIEEKASVNGDVPTLKEKLTYYIFGVTAISFTFFFVIYLMFDMAKILVLVIENVGLAIFALLLLLVLAAIVKIIFSLFATAFKNGVMPVLRLLLLLLIVSAA